MKMERADERFLRYIAIDTASDEMSGVTCPSTESQWKLARLLVQELQDMGLTDARVDAHCYVYASLPATAGCENEKVLGLISHMDTVNSVPSAPIHPRRVVYEGGDLVLNEKLGIVMQARDFPALKKVVGDELIVTDGTTLLGADDKAGVSEIMAAVEHLARHPEIPHGKIAVAFTPDEEIGAGADAFDLAAFGADYAYTVDGYEIDEVEYECFNAASATVEVRGFNIHTGSAKNKMRNAIRIAIEFNGMLPPLEIPENTEGYEGFAHLGGIEGDESRCVMRYIIRDHDMDKFNARKARFEKIAAYLNEKWGEGTVAVSLRDTYYNMRPKIEEAPFVLERAFAALRANGVTPCTVPIRGGTDGARLSYMGLPCPNLGMGGNNCHGVMEYVSVCQMRKMTDVLVTLATAK